MQKEKKLSGCLLAAPFPATTAAIAAEPAKMQQQ